MRADGQLGCLPISPSHPSFHHFETLEEYDLGSPSFSEITLGKKKLGPTVHCLDDSEPWVGASENE